MTERITITIETGNDAFADAPASEVARILADLAAGFADGDVLPAAGESVRILDNNGNTCGCLRIVKA